MQLSIMNYYTINHGLRKRKRGYKLILKNIVSLSFYDKLQRNEQSLHKKKHH